MRDKGRKKGRNEIKKKTKKKKKKYMVNRQVRNEGGRNQGFKVVNQNIETE